MKSTEVKKNSSNVHLQKKANTPFFGRDGRDTFFSEAKTESQSFFPSTIIQPKLKISQSSQKNNIIQREDTKTTETSNKTASTKPNTTAKQTKKCNEDPRFPDFICLGKALELDVSENLQNNGYHFLRVASLYPNDNKLMWDTFMRYGLGVNLLETSFGFMGANKTLSSVLSYGTGIGIKTATLLQSGKLELDYSKELEKGTRLHLTFELNTDPNNLRDVSSVFVGVGFSWSPKSK